jgi:hypothetical protein
VRGPQQRMLYTNELKSWFLAASAWQQIFGLHSRLAIQQVRRAHLTSLVKERTPALLQVSAGSLAPDAKIGAASLPKLQLLNSFVYIT